MTQDAPPTPQHRVGTIGGRPSQSHDVPTSRSLFITRSRLTLPSGRQPRQPAPAATTSLRSPAPPQPPAPRADGAKPRAGASGCSEDRRRGGIKASPLPPAPLTATQFQLDGELPGQFPKGPGQTNEPAQRARMALQPEPAGDLEGAAFNGRSAKDNACPTRCQVRQGGRRHMRSP